MDTHHDNSNSNDNGRLLSTEDIQTVIVTTAEDHMPNDNTIVYGGGNVTNDATQYEVSTLFKLSAQQLQYQNIQVSIFVFITSGGASRALHANGY